MDHQIMKFKTLKHKTLPDTFGHIDNKYVDAGYEIFTSDIPYLQPITATYNKLTAYWEKRGEQDVVKGLNDYRLVLVEVHINNNYGMDIIE